MAEQEKQNINIPIEARIKAAKGLKLGDDRFNPLEKKLYDDIIEEHGEAIASTREAMNAEFGNLLEDVADLSEGNQRQLREVAEMLSVTLQEKDGGLQMNYELFQKILKFQKEHEMKLTGIVDKNLVSVLKKEKEQTQKDAPKKAPSSIEGKQEQTPAQTDEGEIEPTPFVNGSGDEKFTPLNQTKNDSNNIPPPSSPTTPAVTPAPTETVKEGIEKQTPVTREEIEEILSEEGQKLGITSKDIELVKSPLGQNMVDMILYYEGPGGSRQPDIGGTFDVGGGINTGSSENENRYVLGEKNYEAWNSSFIPKEHVRECVQRLLHSRIALTKQSCTKYGIDFDTLPASAKTVLVDMHYNMPNNVHEFKKFWKALQEKNWSEAGKQLVDNGNGNPSGYLRQVYGRAYANAQILRTGEEKKYREFKEGSSSNSQVLYNKYMQSTGNYGKRVGFFEENDIVKNAKDARDITTVTTSVGVLNTQGSTKSITRILDKYIDGNEVRRKELVDILLEQIGSFNRPLQTAAEVGAFQQLFYLAYPSKFAEEMKFIDGEYGPKTENVFLTEAFVLRGESMLDTIIDKPSVEKLTSFEKEILLHNLPRVTAQVSANSPENIIRLAQIMVILNGEGGNIALDGKWTPELEELLNRTPPISSTDKFEASKAREILSKRFQISSSAKSIDDGTSLDRNRTGLIGLRGCAIAGAINLAKIMGNPPGLEITGGTEKGHSSFSFGSNTYTHENGYKLDFGIHPELVSLTGLTGKGGKKTMEIYGLKILFYRHGPNDHFDVTFYPSN